jgi:hypothetical protein
MAALAIASAWLACNPNSLDGLDNGRRTDGGTRDGVLLTRDGAVPDVQVDSRAVEGFDTWPLPDLRPEDLSAPDQSTDLPDLAPDTNDLDVPTAPDSVDAVELDATSVDEAPLDAAQVTDGAFVDSEEAGEVVGPVGTGGASGSGGSGAFSDDGGDSGAVEGSGGVTGSGGSAGTLGSGGEPGSGGAPGSGGTVTVPDAATDAADARPPRPCAGISDSGICWYLGRAGDSCANACANHGGTSPQAASHVGTSAQGGSLSECARLLSLLGVRASVAEGNRSDGLGFGCHVFGNDPWWLTSPPYNDTSKSAAVQIVCGCVQ